MKSKIVLAIFSFLFASISGRAQNADAIKIKPTRTVSFVTVFDKNNASKDGYYYLNGYVVNIKKDLVEKIHMKKIKVSGKVTTVKGFKHLKLKEEVQGRPDDVKHIKNPVIEILE